MPSSRRAGSPRPASLGSTLGRAAHAILPRRRTRRTAPAPRPAPPSRAVTAVFNACRQLDPDGLGIRRASSSIHPDAFSPFLQLDHCGPHHLPARARVQGDAPRKGQQVLSYVLAGEMHYSDSCGNKCILTPGSGNLLTAGSGLAVSHSLRGPVIEYFSVWINIPRDRMAAPPEHRMTRTPPCVFIGQGESAARIRVLAGPPHPRALHKLEEKAAQRQESLDLETAAGKAAVYDVKMQRKSQLVLNPETERVFVYVYRGAAVVDRKTKLQEGDFAVLEQNRKLPLVIESCGVHIETVDKPHHSFDDFDTFEEHACWCLVLAGDPVMEPVTMLSSGIVACTPREIRQAFQDYTCGSMGAASPPASSPHSLRRKEMENSDEDSLDDVDSEIGHAEEDNEIPDVGFGRLE